MLLNVVDMPYQDFGILDAQKIILSAGVVITLLIVAFVVYRVFYKMYINKALKEGAGEGRKRRPMISPGALAAATGIVVWIATMLIIICMVNLNNLFLQQNSDYISQIYRSGARAQQEYEESRLTKEYDFEVGRLDKRTRMVNLKITVTPNITLGKEDKLTFRIGDSKTELKADKEENYVGTVQVRPDRDCPSGILTLESDGEKISQIITNSPKIFSEEMVDDGYVTGEEWQELYPSTELIITDHKISKAAKKQTRIEADMWVYPYAAGIDKELVYTEMTLLLEQNGKALRKVDLFRDKNVQRQDGGYHYHIDETVAEGAVTFWFEAKDREGLTYKLRPYGNILNAAEGEEINQPEEAGDIGKYTEDKYCTIVDKDGNTIQEFVMYYQAYYSDEYYNEE